MNQKLLRFAVVVCAAIGVAGSAFAIERDKLGDGPATGPRAFEKRRPVPALLYALPAPLPDGDVLEIEILQGKDAVVREVVSVPPDAVRNASIDVLHAHPQELTKIRDLETAAPGALRFVVTSANGDVLTDEPFSAIDQKSAALSVDGAVGEVVAVTFNGPARPKRLQANGLTPEPGCAEPCEWGLNSCLEWCDPRGDSCTICYPQYDDCINSCPFICTDPKAITTHTTQTLAGVTTLASSCRTHFGSNTWFDYVSARILVETWERTENCDGSHSDRRLSWYERTENCWRNSYVPCGFSTGYTPYPLC